MSYKEGKESTFTHFGNEYYVDDLIALTKNKPVHTANVTDLEWVFAYTTPDPMRIDQANLYHPVIITYDKIKGKNTYILMDGLHRLAKAIRLKKKTIKCYYVSKEEVATLPLVDKYKR